MERAKQKTPSTPSEHHSLDTYGEWPDYVNEVMSGIIYLQDPFCPGPEEMWVRDPVPYKSELGLTWWKYTKREVIHGIES